MRAVIQRVKSAKLSIDDKLYSEIDKGLVVFIGFKEGEGEDKLDWLVNKICGLRIFEDENGKMNLSVKDVDGGIMLVSNFTLFGECYNGFRPSFIAAMNPKQADEMFNKFIEKTKEKFPHTVTGVFGADMQINQHNDGPITIFIDTDLIEKETRR